LFIDKLKNIPIISFKKEDIMGKEQKEFLRRFKAIELYQQGLKPIQIYKKLRRSKKWFFKYLKVYHLYGIAGLKDKSRRPKKLNIKYAPEAIRDLVETRKDLSTAVTEETKYKFFGAEAVRQELIKKGYSDDQIPKERWINHIIRREGLIIKPDKRRRRKSNKFYPLLKPTKINEVHQIDIVGPRYIKGKGAFFSYHLKDIVSRCVFLEQYSEQLAVYIVDFLVKVWQNLKIPVYLQMDNHCTASGSITHKRSIGKVVRLCLFLGVEPVFIDDKKPWMNGSIESFNSLFDKKLWQKYEFESHASEYREAKLLVQRHNEYQSYSNEKREIEEINSQVLPFEYNKHLKELPLTEGKIHFIRQVNENGEVSILNESFFIDKSLFTDFIWVTVDTGKQTCNIYYQESEDSPKILIKTFPYRLREEVVAFDSKNRLV